MKQFILTKLPYILLFVAVWVLVLFSPVSRCILPDGFSFDAQNILSWKYASTTGFFPVSEIYYPQGILMYYKDTSLIVNILASLLIPTYIMLVGIFFGKRMRSMPKGFLTAVLFLTFVVVFSDLDAFLRYGAGFAFILLFLLLDKEARSKSFTIGLINGLLFTMMTDQGVLALAVMGIGNLLVCILEKNFPVKKMVSSTLRYLGGFFVGFVPLALYLVFTNGLAAYTANLLHFPSVAAYSESPFLPFALHPQNLLVLLPLFSLVLLMTYTHLFRKPEPFTRLQKSTIFLVILTILLEERSLVRSISEQVVFLGPVLWTLFVMRFLQQEKRTEMKIFGLVTGLLGLTLFASTLPNITSRLHNLAQEFEYPKQRICSENMVKRQSMFHPAFIALKPYIRQHFPLYIYPADAALYAAFSAPLPPYSSNYHTAPLYAQEHTIAWFEEQQTSTVVINTKELSMEGIPHVVRTPKLLSYIFSQYCPQQLADGYLVMNRCANKIPTFAGLAEIAPTYAATLQDIQLGDIPRKEWQDKRASFTGKTEPLPLNGKGLYVYVIDPAPQTTLTMYSANSSTKVTMEHCENGCVINPNNLPIFYFEHTLIHVDAPQTVKVEMVRSSSQFLW